MSTSPSSAVAVQKVKRAVIEAVVLRAVPCAAHREWTQGCPDCLTGEEAFARGVAGQQVDDLGVVSDSAWRRFGIAQFLAGRRTRRINRRRGA